MCYVCSVCSVLHTMCVPFLLCAMVLMRVLCLCHVCYVGAFLVCMCATLVLCVLVALCGMRVMIDMCVIVSALYDWCACYACLVCTSCSVM